jgi:hypothetical protein
VCQITATRPARQCLVTVPRTLCDGCHAVSVVLPATTCRACQRKHGARQKAARPPAARPLTWYWLLRPQVDLVGYLAINGAAYQVREQQFEYETGMAGRLWDLRKPDGTTYRLTLNHDGDLACDCPDATYRGRACKHVHAVQAAYEQLDREERLAAFLDEPTGPRDLAPTAVQVPTWRIVVAA